MPNHNFSEQNHHKRHSKSEICFFSEMHPDCARQVAADQQ
jgi:hypothetical protein